MSKRLSWLLILMIALVAFVGCSSDDDPVTPAKSAFETMAIAGAAYVNDSDDCPGVMKAEVLNDNLDLYTVIDIRSEAVYLDGHIPGAYHSSLATLLDDLANTIPSDKDYVIACYSGQSAGHAKIAMELMGYDNVKSLLWGMSSWHTRLDKWSSKCGDNLPVVETENNNGDLVDNAFPTLAGSAGTIVSERVNAMLDEGFQGKAYADIAGNIDLFTVINYFGEADYLGQGDAGVPGHIPGAFQFTPYASLGYDQMLKNIPADKPVVVYCWTGQHSSQIAAYLNMLGYEAYSLTNGSNNLFHSSLTAHQWSPTANEFTLETGYPASETFATIANALAEYVNDSSECPGIIPAGTLNENLSLYTVIDIRSQTDFDLGHIPGAFNSSLGTLLDDLANTIPSDKPYVVVCYSGQSAGHAKIAMEMAGYAEVQSLGWGMSSWHTTLDKWTSKCADNLGTAETVNNNGDLTWHAYPALTGETVASRVGTMLTDGFKYKTYADIQDNLDLYTVVNYFSEADYMGTGTAGVPGHIPGAFQFTPYESMGIGEMLGNIPTDKPVIVYCWSGQHSSQITAYLNMLGYEAYSLLNGSNNLFHSSLTAHKWSATTNEYPLETTPAK